MSDTPDSNAPSVSSSLASDVLAAHLDEETVLLHLGTKRYFHLNVTGQRVWQMLEEGANEATLVDRLALEFDTDRPTLVAEVQALLDTLRELGLVEGGTRSEPK